VCLSLVPSLQLLAGSIAKQLLLLQSMLLLLLVGIS
jgi:hypothetical protein